MGFLPSEARALFYFFGGSAENALPLSALEDNLNDFGVATNFVEMFVIFVDADENGKVSESAFMRTYIQISEKFQKHCHSTPRTQRVQTNNSNNNVTTATTADLTSPSSPNLQINEDINNTLINTCSPFSASDDTATQDDACATSASLITPSNKMMKTTGSSSTNSNVSFVAPLNPALFRGKTNAVSEGFGVRRSLSLSTSPKPMLKTRQSSKNVFESFSANQRTKLQMTQYNEGMPQNLMRTGSLLRTYSSMLEPVPDDAPAKLKDKIELFGHAPRNGNKDDENNNNNNKNQPADVDDQISRKPVVELQCDLSQSV